MRLRTDIITVDGKTTLAVIGGFDPSLGGKKIAHDAMVAHALVMALTEFSTSGVRTREDLCAEDIGQRADEILAEWGFGED